MSVLGGYNGTTAPAPPGQHHPAPLHHPVSLHSQDSFYHHQAAAAAAFYHHQTPHHHHYLHHLHQHQGECYFRARDPKSLLPVGQDAVRTCTDLPLPGHRHRSLACKSEILVEKTSLYSSSYFTTDGQSASHGTVGYLWSLCSGASSLTRGRVCNLLVRLLLGLARALTLGTKSHRTHNHTLLSRLRLPKPGGQGPLIYIPQEQGGPVIPPGSGFPFCRLLRLAGLRWRYSIPPPHGVYMYLCSKENINYFGYRNSSSV
jgi:hypothetical protein